MVFGYVTSAAITAATTNNIVKSWHKVGFTLISYIKKRGFKSEMTNEPGSCWKPVVGMTTVRHCLFDEIKWTEKSCPLLGQNVVTVYVCLLRAVFAGEECFQIINITQFQKK